MITIEHKEMDTYCKYYTGSRSLLARIFHFPSMFLMGEICNECRTLGREHARG